MNADKIQKLGFIAGGLVNIVGILVFSSGMSSEAFARIEPVVFSDFGLMMIMLWGLAYIAAAPLGDAARWLAAVFCLEKLVYVCVWALWIPSNTGQLAPLFAEDPLAASFFAVYGLNDGAFMLFFAWVALRKRAS